MATDIKSFPPMFNSTVVPFFPQIDNSPKNLDNKNESEAGDDIIQRVRTDKLSASVKITVADDYWVRFFYGLYKSIDAIAFKQYSPILQGYDTRSVRIENFKYSMQKKSEQLEAVAGVWDMSFSIEEF